MSILSVFVVSTPLPEPDWVLDLYQRIPAGAPVSRERQPNREAALAAAPAACGTGGGPGGEQRHNTDVRRPNPAAVARAAGTPHPENPQADYRSGVEEVRRTSSSAMFVGVPFCAGMLGGALVLWLGRPDA